MVRARVSLNKLHLCVFFFFFFFHVLLFGYYFSYLAVSWTRTLSKVYRVTYIQGILILRAFRCSFTWILSFPSLAQIGEYTLDAGVPFLVRVAIEYNEQWTTNVCWMMLCNLCKSALRSVLTTTDFVSTCCDPWLSHELFHSPPQLSFSLSLTPSLSNCRFFPRLTHQYSRMQNIFRYEL